MRNQEVTYSNSRVFESSSESQYPIRPDETQGPREVGHTVFQYSQEKQELRKTLNNLHQEYSTMQSNNYLMEEMLRNKSVECDAIKDRLDSLNRKENRCYGEANVLDCKQRTGTNVEGHWLCCGIKCYFIMDNKHWNGCKQTCQDCSLSLLKIDDHNELKFLKSRLTTNSYWIGLKYDERHRKWQWIDNVPSKLDLTAIKYLKEHGGCAFLNTRGIQHHDCGIKHPCICEKRMEKFPDSVY
ncbi:hypothetical protein A6R68_05304, partial [Neotoma lepida]